VYVVKGLERPLCLLTGRVEGVLASNGMKEAKGTGYIRYSGYITVLAVDPLSYLRFI
jgi:hypothetical protein